MASKKIVTVVIYESDGNKDKKYEGRLLGLINDDEFNALARNSVVRGRCITKRTMPLSVITECKKFDGIDGLNGLRLVVAVKKKDGVDCYKKILLVSEKLEYISYVREDGCTAFAGKNNSWMTVEEREV